MTIKKCKGTNRKNGICRLAVEEGMTIYTAMNDRADLVSYVDEYQELYIDLSKVDEIDSAGVQILLALKRNVDINNKRLILTENSEQVTEVLKIFNVTDRFDFDTGLAARA